MEYIHINLFFINHFTNQFTIFCGLLLPIEFKKDFIADQFQFMMTCFLRGIFYILYIFTQQFGICYIIYQPTGKSQSQQVAGLILGLTLWLVVIFYFVIHFVGPKSANAGLKDAINTEYGTA